MMVAGVLIAFVVAPPSATWIFFVSAVVGALLGFGFGSIFSNTGKRRVIAYWAGTLGIIGLGLGFDGPGPTLEASILARRGAYGVAIGLVLGTLSYLFQRKRQSV